jgi:ribonuclease P/MRP protein subunit RPP40
VYEIIQKEVVTAEDARPVYSRVILPLKSLLEEDFFNEYIKKGMPVPVTQFDGYLSGLSWVTGNVLMLSEGRAGIDNMYSLKEGRSSEFLVSK